MTFTETQLKTIDTVWQFYCQLFGADPASYTIQLGKKRIIKLYDDSCSDEVLSVAFGVAENAGDFYERPDWKERELEGFNAWLTESGALTDPE